MHDWIYRKAFCERAFENTFCELRARATRYCHGRDSFEALQYRYSLSTFVLRVQIFVILLYRICVRYANRVTAHRLMQTRVCSAWIYSCSSNCCYFTAPSLALYSTFIAIIRSKLLNFSSSDAHKFKWIGINKNSLNAFEWIGKNLKFNAVTLRCRDVTGG